MNQRWRLLALWALPLLVAAFLGWQLVSGSGSNLANSPLKSPANTAVGRMSYGRFLEYVDNGRVNSVDFYNSGRTAVVEVVDADLDNRVQRLRVDLPGIAPDLLGKLKDQSISFDIHAPKQPHRRLGSLATFCFLFF